MRRPERRNCIAALAPWNQDGLRYSRSCCYEVVCASLMSASASVVAVLLADFESAFGGSAWMDLPRLSLLEPVPAGQVAPAAGGAPVMSAFMHANGTLRL